METALLRRVLPACALIALLGGCSGDDESAPVSTGPAGPATLRVISVGGVPVGDPLAGDMCVPLSADADRRLPVQIATVNWLLRPPGACAGTAQCGTAVLLVDGAPNAASVSSTIEGKLGALPSPAGAHALRVELRQEGTTQPATGADAGLLAVDLTVRTVLDAAACAADGGADGGKDAAAESDAGEGGSDGAAGDVAPDAPDGGD